MPRCKRERLGTRTRSTGRHGDGLPHERLSVSHGGWHPGGRRRTHSACRYRAPDDRPATRQRWVLTGDDDLEVLLLDGNQRTPRLRRKRHSDPWVTVPIVAGLVVG